MTDATREVRLAMPPRGGMTDARFRLFSGLFTLPLGVALVVMGGGYISKAFGVVGILVAIGWMASFRRAKSAPDDTRELVLDDSSVTLRNGRDVTRVRWDRITDIDVEEDAATLVLRVDGGDPVRVEPGYGGLDTIALNELLARHRSGAIETTRS